MKSIIMFESGYEIVKVYNKNELPELIENFEKTCENLDEFTGPFDTTITLPNGNKAGKYALGSFGNICVPGAHHNPFARRVRADAYAKAIPILKELKTRLYSDEEKYFQCLFSGMNIRYKGVTVQDHKWHRDILKDIDDTTVVIGGWIAFQDTTFCYVPNTTDWYNTNASTKSGFTLETITPEYKDELKQMHVKIPIPAGHLFMFGENTLHKLAPLRNLKEPIYRFYIGWKIGTSERDLETELIIKHQALPNAPSGIKQKMYSNYHASYLLDSILKPWSLIAMNPTYLTPLNIVPRLLDFPCEKGKYPPYNDHDLKIMLPHLV